MVIDVRDFLSGPEPALTPADTGHATASNINNTPAQQAIGENLWQEFEEELKKMDRIEINFAKSFSSTQKEILFKFWDIFLTEQLPAGAINSALEKNFAVYIIQNKISLEKVKEIYEMQKWKIGGLLGWIKEVESGRIKELNVGELINWCKKYDPALIELFIDWDFDETRILNKKDLKFMTSHLPIYNDVDYNTQIVGEEYKHAKKLLCYHLVSGIIPETSLIVTRGQMEIDLRDFLFLVYPTGSAKGNIKNLIIRLWRDLGKEAVTLTSYHEEQLIGKVIKRKRRVENGTGRNGVTRYRNEDQWIKNEGHFKADEILLDECKPLLTERDKTTSRNFFLLAMDKYGDNEMFKRLTENLDNPDEILRFFPKFNALFGTQPYKFREDYIILNGFLKRVTTDYLPQTNRPDSYFDSRLDNKTVITGYYDNLIDSLENLGSLLTELNRHLNSSPWTFADDFDKTFKECFKYLRSAGLFNTRKKRNYTQLVEWQLQNRLLKKSCLLALMKNETTYVTSEHVELAFLDLLEDFIIELDFINEKIYGKLDYGSVFGEDEKEEELFNFLYNSGAVSAETSEVTIEEFQNKIKEIYKTKEDNARRIYNKFKKNDLIDSKRVGQHSSKVWIASHMQEFTTATSATSDINVKAKYFELINKYSASAISVNA
ncbi:MAG: hypothetical protein M1416_02785 [Candidatus Pacearchaeota archaeon]|nr:hypothetical protein [Candidatus Pacearchaeota archaeon]